MADRAAGVRIAVPDLEDFTQAIFEAAGCAPAEAQRIATSLVAANVSGHDSHGVVRVPRYLAMLELGEVRAGQRLTVINETPVRALVDGNFGFGQTIAPLAVELGIAKAKENGVSVIGLRNSGHVGRIGEYAEQAAAAGLISIHFVNVRNGVLVAPFGGVDRRFSTNPFCAGVPVPGGTPLILDFATSVVAEGKVLVASRGGKPVPDDAMIEPDGTFSSDPRTLYGPITASGERQPGAGKGALRAFGGHKGSGLAFLCELLAGCLTGGGTSGPLEARERRIANAMLSLYIAPEGFAAANFGALAEGLVAYTKSARPSGSGGEVLVPGEPENRTRAERRANGVPLAAATWTSIIASGKAYGLAAPAATGGR